MYFSSRTFRIVSGILRHKCFISKNYVTVIKLPNNIVRACYSTKGEPKQAAQSPLGNLLAKDAKDRKLVEQKAEPDDEEKNRQSESAWRTMKITLATMGISFTCLGIYLIVVLGSPEKGEDGRYIEDEFSGLPVWKQYILRTYRELDYYRRLIREPSRLKLLPDPLTYPYVQPKYTLVLELTDVLVHADWTYSTGWRFKKRPALDFFLEALHPYYEIIVYTAEQGMTVFPLLDAIDPKHYISYRLVRDATHFVDGHHVKSLDKLNRDLSKVVVIDWNANRVKFHPENLFNINKWDGRDDDASLIDLALFLKTIADNDIDDVRDVLRHYSNFEDPISAFRENQRRYMDHLEAEADALKHQKMSTANRWVPSFLRRD